MQDPGVFRMGHIGFAHDLGWHVGDRMEDPLCCYFRRRGCRDEIHISDIVFGLLRYGGDGVAWFGDGVLCLAGICVTSGCDL